MSVSFLERDGKPDLAYIYTPHTHPKRQYPLVMFCGGYRSDMMGTKAQYLENQCKARGQGYLRFDYSGHGQSHGVFEEGTIGSWLDDALDIFDAVAKGQPVIVVGSSMGGWISLLLAHKRAGSVKAVLGLAPAPDFSETMYDALSDEQKAALDETGLVKISNDYSDEPYHYSKAFYEEAKNHLVLTRDHRNEFPIRLIHGMLDKDVPWEWSRKIQNAYKGSPVDITFIDDGDHRLSRPEDLEVIDRELKILSDVL